MKMIGFQLCNIIPHYAGRHFCEWDAPGFTLKRLDGFFGDPEVSGSSCWTRPTREQRRRPEYPPVPRHHPPPLHKPEQNGVTFLHSGVVG